MHHHRPLATTIAAITFSLTGLAGVCAENLVFPQDARLIDVTQPPYNARGDGKTDDTAAIQRALDAVPSGNRVIYLPAGTYLVSRQLRWPPSRLKRSSSGNAHKRTILQGQSRDRSVIRLIDNAPDFQNRPTSVIWTGTAPAQRFRNSIRDLTVHTGFHNPGAIGIQFIANNQGTLHNVRIVSGDGQGKIGLDLSYTGEIGPCLVRNLEVVGFDYGIKAKHGVNSITLAHIECRDQKLVALHNDGQVLSLQDFRSLQSRSIPAIVNQAGHGIITILQATLKTVKSAHQPAISNRGKVFIAGLSVSGYSEIVSGQAASSEVIPYFVHPAPRQPFNRDLLLQHLAAIKPPQPPYPSWEQDLSKWITPALQPYQKGIDDTQKIQEAIDAAGKSGATTLYFPAGRNVHIRSTLFIRGSIRHILGTETALLGNGRIIIEESASAEPLLIERFDGGCAWIKRASPVIIQRSRRPLILSAMQPSEVQVEGRGPVFLDDIGTRRLVLGPQTSVWCRQLNTENPEQTNIINNGGKLFILGLKTEQAQTKIHTLRGGHTILLGAFIYAQGKPKTRPCFLIEDATACLIGIRQFDFHKPLRTYSPLIRHQSGGSILQSPRGSTIIPLFLTSPPVLSQ